jgi:hypothetical protein
VSRSAVRVRSWALFFLQSTQKRRAPDVGVGRFVSNRLYANASSMMLAASLSLLAIQCE